MERNRKIPTSAQRPIAKPPVLELPPERAFVVHLDVRAQPPRRVVGRVEHVTSGQVAHVTCLRELVAFVAKVLRNQVRGERGTMHEALIQEPRQDQLASSPRSSVDEDAARAAGPRSFRRHKGGTES